MFGCAIHFEHKINQQKRWKLGNGNWRFVDHRVYQYTQEDRRYYTATLVYMFERKPTTHLIIFIVPLFVLVLLAPLVFLLPKDGGDRMGLALTVLLAVSVYMTLVADRLPDASEPVPIVTSVFFVWYISNAMIVIVVLVNSRIYKMNPKRLVPRIIQQFVFFTARLFCIVDQVEEEAILANQNGDLVEDDEQNRVLTSEKQRRYKITWKHVSSALDKWLVTGLYAAKAIFAVSILTWLSNGDKDKVPYKELEEGQEPYVYEDNLPPA
ncbi:acetylcholine receptor subunit beta-like [Mya arenaria]|uniref:acetylcholine receptor subunit beta-like n=1 Tax=Mya arenaria TaxID=6604 RepID=UPI0022DF3191|nr:acetylcholine receptor subunit beta-like [Mya arenaria]